MKTLSLPNPMTGREWFLDLLSQVTNPSDLLELLQSQHAHRYLTWWERSTFKKWVQS